MDEPFLAEWATFEDASKWLESQSGQSWPFPRLLKLADVAVRLDCPPDATRELLDNVFQGRREGFMAPLVFEGDIARLASLPQYGLLSCSRRPDGATFDVRPLIRFELSELRFSALSLREIAAACRDERSIVGAPASRRFEHFVLKTWPLEIPARLREFPADAEVSYERRIGDMRQAGVSSAGEFIEHLQQIIDRYATGFFTMNEAAQILADHGLASDAKDTSQRLKRAHSKGELRAYKAGSRLKLDESETAREWLDFVKASELDAWLKDSAGYGFPPTETPHAQSPLTTPESIPVECLASPQELVDAFGPFTGMTLDWFASEALRDAPELKRARVQKGSGGTGHRAKGPLFCPFKVLCYLTNPKRRKGRNVASHNAWRMFKAHFAASYEIHQSLEPNP
jgi:hypothetical protein